MICETPEGITFGNALTPLSCGHHLTPQPGLTLADFFQDLLVNPFLL